MFLNIQLFSDHTEGCTKERDVELAWYRPVEM